MKRLEKLSIAVIIVASVVGVAGFGYLMYETLRHEGEEAVALMNAEERQALARIDGIHKGMNAADVSAVLGPPSSDLYLLEKWDGFGGSRLSQLRIYFQDGHPRTIRWLKLGSFIYEKHL